MAHPERTYPVALSGSGGSHPGTIGAICSAIAKVQGVPRPLIVDLSLFDSRGTANYSQMPGELIRVDPGQLGFRQVFKTAAPNLVLSGGVRRFELLVQHFEQMLDAHRVGVMLMCHAYGIPEQALMQACIRSKVPLARIDEGPFSVMVKPKGAPTPGLPMAKIFALEVLKKLQLLPERDWSGVDVDRFFATSAGRVRDTVKKGILADRVRLVSAPRFDRLADACRLWEAGSLERRNHAAKRVLVLHQPFKRDGKVRPRPAARAENELFSALRQVAARRRIEVAVRMHPRADAKERARYAELLAGVPMCSVAADAGGFYEVMPQFDLFAGFYSSALLEAAASGAPVVSAAIPTQAFYRGNEGAKAAAMGRFGVGMAVSAADLAALIDRGLDARRQPPPEALFDQQLGPLSSGGANEVAEQLLEMATTAKPRWISRSGPDST